MTLFADMADRIAALHPGEHPPEGCAVCFLQDALAAARQQASDAFKRHLRLGPEEVRSERDEALARVASLEQALTEWRDARSRFIAADYDADLDATLRDKEEALVVVLAGPGDPEEPT